MILFCKDRNYNTNTEEYTNWRNISFQKVILILPNIKLFNQKVFAIFYNGSNWLAKVTCWNTMHKTNETVFLTEISECPLTALPSHNNVVIW